MSTYPMVQLRRLTHIVNGGTPTPDLDNWNGDVQWATPVDLAQADGGSLDRTDRTLTDEGLRTGSATVPMGSLILSTRAPIGYVTRVTAPRMAFNQGCRGLVPNERVDARYLQYWLTCQAPSLQGLGTGSTFLELSSAALLSFRVPLPPLAEQRRIAHFLDDQVGRIEAAAALREGHRELLSEKHQAALLRGAFGTSDIRPPSRETWHGTVSLAAGAAVDSTPASWSRRRLKTVARRSDETMGTRDIPLLSLASAGHLYPRDIDKQPPAPESLPRYLVVRPGDLVVNPMWLVGGAVAVSDKFGCVSPDYRVFRVSGEIEARFLHHVLRTRPYIDQYRLYTRADTTFDRRVQQGDLDNLPLSLPDIDTQRRVAAHLDDLTTTVHKALDLIDSAQALLAEWKSSLITAAVTGKLDPATMSDRAGKVAVG